LNSKKNETISLGISPSKKTIASIDSFSKNLNNRIKDAMNFYLLDVANFLLNEIKKAGVSISINGRNKKYADDLRIGILSENTDNDHVAIYLDSSLAEINEEYSSKTVLYFMAHAGSPKWVKILNRYGPWPSNMIPFKITLADAKIVSRLARRDELFDIQNRILSKSDEIERALLNAGSPIVNIGENLNAIGLKVYEDIGYNVLRREFGFDGYKKESHWRPAIKKTKKYADESMNKIGEYLQSGDKYIFDLPENVDNINLSVVKNIEYFEKKIEPFIK
jgi:hypothetical protein